MQENHPLLQKANLSPSLPPSPTTTFEGTHCRVVPLNPTLHSQSLFSGLSDPSLWTYVYKNQEYTRAPQSPQQLISFFATYPYQFYVIQKKGDTSNHCLGCYSLFIYPDDRACQVAYILFSKDLQKTAMGTESLYLIIKHAFEDLNYNKCYWKCHMLNIPSRAAALRYGFKHELRQRGNLIHRGCYRDTDYFSILRKEWKVLGEEFERWLGEGNFGEKGEQKSKLRNAEIRKEIDREDEERERLWEEKKNQ